MPEETGITEIAEQKVEAPTYERIFHHEGKFEDGAKIQKSFFWGAERYLVVNDGDFEQVSADYQAGKSKYEQGLPQQEIFPNGLSREQAVRTMSAFETIVKFNGGIPDEHTEERNAQVYSKGEEQALAEGEATIPEFKGKKALTCIEMGAMAQQMLADEEKMTHISGAADLRNTGQYEGHTFNLIETSDSERPVAVLDMANPAYQQGADGTMTLKLYCAPMTTEQYDAFKQGQPVKLDYAGQERTYQYGMGADSPFKYSW